MKIVLCYIYVTNGVRSGEFACRFTETYHYHEPGVKHDTIVIANGGSVKTEDALLFGELKPMVLSRLNDAGWDISGYIAAAHAPCEDYDMMLCLGESNYFHREGWLSRLVYAWQKYGPGMYGPYATNVVRGHLQTTAFCCPPSLLIDYPLLVRNKADRYEFEHGEKSLMRFAINRRMPVRLVTWDGEYLPHEWRRPTNVLWSGDQSNCLMWSNHSDAFKDADMKRKRNWENSANRAFR